MRFLRTVITIWLLMTVLISGTNLYGHIASKPSDLEMLGFGVCDSRPCFVGIIPGITTGKEALSLLSKYDSNVLVLEEGRYILARVNNFSVSVILDENGENVISLSIPLFKDSVFPSLGSFIAMYGVPCSVNGYEGGEHIDVNYPYLSLGARPAHAYVRSDSALDYVMLSSMAGSPLNCISYDYDNEGLTINRWLGFTRFERYQYRPSPATP